MYTLIVILNLHMPVSIYSIPNFESKFLCDVAGAQVKAAYREVTKREDYFTVRCVETKKQEK